MGKKSILLFADWFEPGYKACGPIRSCINFVKNMKYKYRIYVYTSDRDLDETCAYSGIIADKWVDFDNGVKVMYASPNQLSWQNVYKQIKKIGPDYIYLNSMYSRNFSLYPLLLRRIGMIKSKIILAPRGMLGSEALRIKGLKKRLFLMIFKAFGFHKIIHFHVTNDGEENDLVGVFGKGVSITKVSNFIGDLPAQNTPSVKSEGSLRLIYISRIHPIKNLDFLLSILSHVRGNILLTIIGASEHKQYAFKCKEKIAGLPTNIVVEMKGEVPFNELPELLKSHHIFVLPTKGENFGHVIFEALALGKPVLISDQTPWKDLEQNNAGWDISLNNENLFIAAINQAVCFNQEEYNLWSNSSWNYAKRFAMETNLQEEYYKLFN